MFKYPFQRKHQKSTTRPWTQPGDNDQNDFEINIIDTSFKQTDGNKNLH